MRIAAISLALALGVLLSLELSAAQTQYRLVIKNHRFEPPILTVPAGEKIQLIVENQDPSAEEFESYELRREKIIPGGSQATIWIGPLSPGEYPFVGEFHPKTAQGRIVAK